MLFIVSGQHAAVRIEHSSRTSMRGGVGTPFDGLARQDAEDGGSGPSAQSDVIPPRSARLAGPLNSEDGH